MDKKRLLKRDIAHFGTIAFNYSCFGVGLIILGLLSSIVMFMITLLGFTALLIYFVILIVVTIFTIGILLFAEEFRNLWAKGVDSFSSLGNIGEFTHEKLIPFLSEALPAASIIILTLSIISFICMMFDRKWEKAKPRLVFMGIVIVALILLIISLFTGILIIGGAK